jgi:hypothetical protein
MARLTTLITCALLTAGSALASAAAPADKTTAKPAATTATPASDPSSKPMVATASPAPSATKSSPMPVSGSSPSATVTAMAPAAGSTKSPAVSAKSASDDSTLSLRAGQDGTVFRSLTVEGEDRIHFDFERPPLNLELDPQSAPGLDWGTARDVLDRTVPDLATPLVSRSARQTTAGVAHPWLGHFNSGEVVKFRPDVKGVQSWTLTIVDAHGDAVASYTGRGAPPREITWDGRSKSGAPITPGLTYSYVFEARDRAGNKRNFVGQGFRVAAYRLETADGPIMVLSGTELPAPDPTRPASATGQEAAPIVIEAASWLNQSTKNASPVRVTATCRTAEAAQALAASVVRQMTPHILGDPARLQAVTEVRPDAPERGAVRISTAR